MKNLQGDKRGILFEIDCLRGEKGRLETAIATDKTRLEETLAQALIYLKIQRPDLFTLSGSEQIAMLLKVFLK